MIGREVGSYRIIATLGSGGMGTVYRAEHVALGRPAAVKVLRPELSRDHDIVQRFFNEARATAGLRHPGIVDVFDFGHLDDGRAWLLMELLEGEALDQRLARGPLSPAEAADLLRQAAAALTAAHARGIVHRDIKPQNLFLCPDQALPSGLRLKVLDFGIAKLRPDIGPPSPETSTGVVLGSPYYMSPEQCRGARDVDARSDVYALACVLFEMLTSQRPFTGASTAEVMAAHLHVPPPPLRAVRTELSAPVERVVLQALEKEREARTPTVTALADDFDAALTGRMPPERRAGAALAATVAERPGAARAAAPTPPGRRSRWRVLALGATLVAGATAAILVATSRRQPRARAPVAGAGPGRDAGRAATSVADAAPPPELTWAELGMDPSLVDPVALLPHVKRVANRKFAVHDIGVYWLVASNVQPSGLANLTSRDATITYHLRSTTLRASQGCYVRAIARAGGLELSALGGQEPCNEVTMGPPRCSIAQLWQRALERGAPSGLPARVSFDPGQTGREWSLHVDGSFSMSGQADHCAATDGAVR